MGVHEGRWHTCTELSRSSHSTLDPLSSLVVAHDDSVHIAQRRVCVLQSNGWQVTLRCLCGRLVVSPRVSSHQKMWLLEGYLDLVSEGSGSDVPSRRSGYTGRS